MLNVEDIKALIKEIDQSSIHEFLYQKNDVKIKLKKYDGPAVQEVIGGQVPAVVETPAPQVVQQVDTEDSVTVDEVSDSVEAGAADKREITSPMVGTFYRRPSPDSENYVNIGDKVDESTVVCIVEAMKLFNEIEAEQTGEIIDILVEDGELVEYGQPLFIVK